MGHRLAERPRTGSRPLTTAKGIRVANSAVIGSTAIIPWTEDGDTDNAFNGAGGTFTAPRDMRLKVKAVALIVEAIATTRWVGLELRKNGVQIELMDYKPGINQAASQIVRGEWVDDIAAGDVIDVRVYDTSSGWSVYGADGVGKWSWISYEEVPPKAVFPATFAPVVTSLPTTGNYDGREVDLVADATNGVIWRMRYRASTTRWHFVGGPPLRSYTAAEQGIATAAYNDLSTVTDITFPFAGDYNCQWGSYFYGNTAGTSIRQGLVNPGAVPLVGHEVAYGNAVAANYIANLHAKSRFDGITAGQVKRLRYFQSTGTAWWGERYVEAIPIRSAAGF